MTYGIKELDRSGGFYVRNYFGVKILIDKYPENWLTRRYAIWAIRHPNKVLPTMDNINIWGSRVGWLEITPIVENPDPTQLEKLKEIPAGGIRECIREYMTKEEEE